MKCFHWRSVNSEGFLSVKDTLSRAAVWVDDGAI